MLKLIFHLLVKILEAHRYNNNDDNIADILNSQNVIIIMVCKETEVNDTELNYTYIITVVYFEFSYDELTQNKFFF